MMIFLQVLSLQQRILPLGLHPGPDCLYGIEVGGARGQKLNDSSLLFKELSNYVSSMGSVVVHYNHLLVEVELPMELFVEVLNGLLICGVRYMVEEDFHLLADGSNDGHIALLLQSSLDNQWQNRVLGLPDLASDGPHVCGGLVHVDDLSISLHVANDLLDIFDSQPRSLLFAPGAVEARMGLQVANF